MPGHKLVDHGHRGEQHGAGGVLFRGEVLRRQQEGQRANGKARAILPPARSPAPPPRPSAHRETREAARNLQPRTPIIGINQGHSQSVRTEAGIDSADTSSLSTPFITPQGRPTRESKTPQETSTGGEKRQNT